MMSIYDDPAYAEFLKGYAPEPAAPTASKKPLTRTWGEVATDTGLAFAGGGASLAKGIIGTAVGNDNEVYDYFDRSSQIAAEGMSAKSKAQDAELARQLKEGDLTDAGLYALSNPTLLTRKIIESMPSMGAGAGVGGLLVKGGMGVALASGVGEGTIMATDVFDKTGSGAAALGALALGTVTGGLTPSNVIAGVMRKGAGEVADASLPRFLGMELPSLAKEGMVAAGKRGAMSVAQEGGQEFVQETGQALLEQGGKGEELDLQSAMKQGVVGAVVGGVMGGGMHPVIGEGSKAAELAAAENVLTQDPTNPVAQAEVALLRAQRDYVEAAPGERDALKPAITVAEAAVLAARNPESREAADNLDTLRSEAAIEAGGMAGARVAADTVSIETSRAIAEAQTGDEARQSFADGQLANSTLTVGAQAVQNTRKGAVQGAVTAVQDEVARIKETRAASNTVSETEFPVEVVASTPAPKVSDVIGLTRDTPFEVAAATPLPTIDFEQVGQQATAEAVANPDLPTINAEALGTSTLSNPLSYAGNQAAPGSLNAMFDEAAADEQINAEAEMQQAGFIPEVAKAMRAATPAELTRQVMDPGTHPARANLARIVLQRQGIQTDPAVLEARANLDREVEAFALRRGQSVESVRMAVGGLGQASVDSILNNSASQDHAIARAVAALRGWEVAPAAETQLETIPDTEGTLTAEMIQELAAERLITVRGYLNLPSRVIDTFTDDAPTNAANAMMDLVQFRAVEGVDLSDFDEQSQTVIEWGLSPEGVDAGVSEESMTMIIEARAVMGLVEDKDALQAELQDELDAELSPTQINDKIAELERLADDENMPDEQRADARQQVREMRRERDAARAASAPSQHTPNPRAARAPRGQPVTRAGVRSVQTAFDQRAITAQRDGTLTKLGKFWKTLMSARNAGQRVLPRIDTRDLKTSIREAVRRDNRLPQQALEEVRTRYNAKLKQMAEQWATDNNKPLGAWVDPIASIRPTYNNGFGVTIYGLGRGGDQNPYAIRPGTQPTSFSADTSIHAVDLQNAPGSADLAYRLAAEIGNLRGIAFPSDSILSTVNNLRRALQSMSADTMFAPGVINPLTSLSRTSRNETGPQGVPPTIWHSANEVEKIGLNALRVTHSITEKRPYGQTGGNWLENLVFDRQGRIVAFTDPKPLPTARGMGVTAPFGFPRGTIVTDEMLEEKIGEINPSTGYSTFAQRSEGTGGIGADTARLAILNNTILNEIEDKPDAEIPAWIGTVARAKGREQGGWFFSEADQAPAAGMTKAEAENVVRDAVGDKVAQVLLDTGLVSFVETPAELAEMGGVPLTSVAGGVQGATMPDGKIVLVTGNLTSKNASAVLQHEALHATLKGLVGEDTYNRLMARLDTLVQAGAGAQWVTDAKAAVPKNTPAENVTEEIAAYAVEQYVANPESTNPLVRWARDFMSALRSAIIQNTSLPEALRVWAIQNVQPQDLSRMAIAGLKKSAVTSGPTRMSQRDFGAEINALMEELKTAAPERRVEINDELRIARNFQRAQEDVNFEEGYTNEPSNIRGETAGVPAQAEYGNPIGGAVSVEATHFSNSQRNTLNTSAYGTGLKGEEAGRLAEPGNADIRNRTHFYVNEGTGIRPEAGVGSVAHNVKLNNLYDLKADPAGYRAFNRENPSAMERAIVQAGYDGYYAPDYTNGQGVAVVIGDHAIPVSVGEGGVNVLAQYEGDTYAAKLAASKLPGGSMLGREWSVALKGGEFATANVMAELENRQNQRVYRDDLPRFNKPSKGKMRFSIAQEINAVTAPVAESPAPQNELNIANRKQLGAMERLVETLRGWLQDKHVTLRRIQQLAGVTAEQLQIDTIGALDRLGSKMSSTHKRLVKEPLAKIENILQASYRGEADAGEKAHADMNKLLIALHAPEYNERMATINPQKFDASGNHMSGYNLTDHPGSGVRTEDALKTSEALLSGKHGEALQAAVDEYRKMIANLQDYAVERGLENKAVIEAWRNPETGFPNYTPFHRELDLEDNYGIGTARGAQGFSLRTGITQRAMGSSAKIFDPLASTLILGTRIVSRGENAVVARTMFEFAKSVAPNYLTRSGTLKPMWKVDVIPQTRVIKNTNVYRVRLADGSQSAEFYNREQSRLYADAQQALWENQNPGVDPDTSGIISEFIETAERVFIQEQPNHLNQENIMVIPVEGENHIITFDEDSMDGMAILNALKGKNAVGGSAGTKVLNEMLTPFRMFSRWTVAMATGYNPIFMFFNSARDVQGAMLNAKDGGIPGWGWSDSRGIAKDFLPAARAINQELKGEFKALHSNDAAPVPPAQGSWGWWKQQAETSGGLTGVMEHITEPEDAQTMIRRLYGAKVEEAMLPANEVENWLTKMNRGMVKIGDTFYRFGEGETQGALRPGSVFAAGIARWNTASELATRTTVFKRATEKYMEKGYTQEEAMQMAAVVSKNISTNFNRRGNASTFLNQMFPFFNAAIQGSARLAEAMFKKGSYTIDAGGGIKLTAQNTDYFTPYGKVVLKSLAALGGMQAVLLAAAGFDDEEPPDAIKDRAFIIPLFNKDKDYIAIPMPHGFNTLINFGRHMAGMVIEGAQGNGMKAAAHLGKGTLGQMASFNPLGGQGNLFLGMSPALTDPAIALYMNEDVFGRKIAQEDQNPADVTPGFTRTKEGGTKHGRLMAEGLNWITGGNADQPGFISPTGDQIDYLIGEVGGGLTREVVKGFQTGVAMGQSALGIEREELPVNKVPLIGRVFGTVNSTTGVRSRAFELRKELNSLDNRYKGLMERGEKEEAAAFEAEHPELSLADDFNRLSRANSKANKQRALSRNKGDTDKVNTITETQTEKTRRLLDKYDALKIE